jgi:hypothetical protein
MAVVTRIHPNGTRREERTLDHRLGGDGAIWGSVVIRLATAGDRPALERLAELDSAERPRGMALIAEIHERPVAALALADGRAIADPFVATGDIIELLRVRAGQLTRRRDRRPLSA